jgi:hypothetical protein
MIWPIDAFPPEPSMIPQQSMILRIIEILSIGDAINAIQDTDFVAIIVRCPDSDNRIVLSQAGKLAKKWQGANRSRRRSCRFGGAGVADCAFRLVCASSMARD